MSNISGSSPTSRLSTALPAAMSHTSTRWSSPQATSSRCPPGANCMCRGRLHKGALPTTVPVAASMMAMALSFSEDTYTLPLAASAVVADKATTTAARHRSNRRFFMFWYSGQLKERLFERGPFLLRAQAFGAPVPPHHAPVQDDHAL